ncbi:hypothetical protein DITRI_Ditri07aG0139500 [Diplodiscus trichospermus]
MSKNTGSFILLLILVVYPICLCAAKCKRPEDFSLHEIYITNFMSHEASMSYDCAQNVNLWEWRIYETYAELYSLDLHRWVHFDYEPVKYPSCYEDLCVRFLRGYCSQKAPSQRKLSAG